MKAESPIFFCQSYHAKCGRITDDIRRSGWGELSNEYLERTRIESSKGKKKNKEKNKKNNGEIDTQEMIIPRVGEEEE